MRDKTVVKVNQAEELSQLSSGVWLRDGNSLRRDLY